MTRTLNPMARHHDHCRDTRAQMSDYLDGELDAAAGSAMERHTNWCPNCRRMLTSFRRTLGGLRYLREQPFSEEVDIAPRGGTSSAPNTNRSQ